MSGERISVVVPAYNSAPWLPRCLDSLLAQTYDNLEIIVVDDGSTDDTPAVMREYAARDSRIQAIRKENGGVTSARLQGVVEASGSWIGFADSDDWAEPWMFARLMENALAYGADISHCGYQVVFPVGRVEYLFNSGHLRQQDRQEALRDLLEEKRITPGLCSKLYRRELFRGLEEHMDPAIRNNEDMLMNFCLFSRADRAVYEDVCPYHYLIRSGSASRQPMNEHMIYDPIRVRQIILDACGPELRDDARRALARMCLVVYGQLTLEKGGEYRQHRANVRRMVAEQMPYLPVLPRRNALLVRMITKAPWLFGLLYPVYAALFKRE